MIIKWCDACKNMAGMRPLPSTGNTGYGCLRCGAMTFDEDDFSSEEQLDAVAEFALKHFPWVKL